MRKLVILILLAAVMLPAAAQSDVKYFPMDTGRTWVFDDGSVDRIAGFKKFAANDAIKSKISDGNATHLYMFDPYFHSKRVFFVENRKVYEWTENNRRLIYDFSANVGDSWQIGWNKIETSIEEKKRNPRLNDLTQGALMTLVEKNVTVKTPLGEYSSCIHFRLTRPDVTGGPDHVIKDEYFAPEVGCVIRVWGTIAGSQQQKLANIIENERPNPLLRLDLSLDKEIYQHGEDIVIDISILNWSDREIVLDFPTSLQVDYVIDDLYAYSDNLSIIPHFSEAPTTITIPARDVYNLSVVHTDTDFDLTPGKHFISATVVGTNLQKTQEFIVKEQDPIRPEGIELIASTDKNTYSSREPVEIILTLMNTTDANITLKIVEKNPLKFNIENIIHYPAPLAFRGGTADVVIPGGQSIILIDEINADRIMLKPGDYTIKVGLIGYDGLSPTDFSVTRETSSGSVSGIVVEGIGTAGLSAAHVRLKPYIPRDLKAEFTEVVLPKNKIWVDETDDKGGFQFADVPLGNYYSLIVEAEGFLIYQRTIRVLSDNTELVVNLKKLLPLPLKPMNYRKYDIDGLLYVFGTGRSVYEPDATFKAFMEVFNRSGEEISFTFADENTLNILVNGLASEQTDGLPEKTAAMNVYLTIAPGESHRFEKEVSFKDFSAKTGKVAIEGTLMTTSGTSALKGVVAVLITDSNNRRIEAKAFNKQMHVNLRDELKASIDIKVKDDTVEGTLNISEMKQNHHKPRLNNRMLKMIEVDADAAIRDGIENAVIRIYFDPDELGDGVKSEDLSMAHWHEISPEQYSPTGASTGEATEWTPLSTQVNTVENFVEASTAKFSSFGLFVPDTGTSVEDDESLPKAFMLKQNRPNPFNPTTLIEFHIAEAGLVKLTVYNIIGQEVARPVEEFLPAGAHHAVFNGVSNSSGVYFYRLETPGFTATRKMVLIK